MIYLADLLFIVGYLVIKDAAMYMIDYNFDVYCRVRKYYLWFECGWVIGGILYIPKHTYTEAAIAFFMCMITKGVHDLVKKNSNKLTQFERNFETRKHEK